LLIGSELPVRVERDGVTQMGLYSAAKAYSARLSLMGMETALSHADEHLLDAIPLPAAAAFQSRYVAEPTSLHQMFNTSLFRRDLSEEPG